jgi:hypothetical protein
MLIVKPKHIAISIFLLLIIGAAVLYGTNSVAQKLTLDNIILVKKIVHHDPELTAQKIHSYQKMCTNFKEKAYETTKIASVAPKPEDYTSIDEIRKFQNVTETEYFSGNRYARYEIGQKLVLSESQSKPKSPDEIDCSLKVEKYITGEIRTPNQFLQFSKTGNDQGKINVANLKAGLFERIQMPTVPKNVETITLENTNFKCMQSIEIPKCYFKDMPIHVGTKKAVILQITTPQKGVSKLYDALNEMETKMETQTALAAFGDGTMYRGSDFVALDRKFDSISIGKEIPESKFDMSMFKDYKIIKQN